MAGRRRMYRRHTRRGRSGRPNRKPNIQSVGFRNVSAMSVGQAARYGAIGYNILKGLINSELKRFDVISTVTPSSTGSVVSLVDIAAGDDAMNRDGNKILGKYIRFQYFINMAQAATATLTRIILFVDTENQGTAPTIANLLQDGTSPGNLTSPVNIDSTQRYTILFDDKVTTNIDGDEIRYREHYKSLNFHISYTDTTTSGRNKNSIWVAFLSNESTNVPSVGYSSRLAFYDN